MAEVTLGAARVTAAEYSICLHLLHAGPEPVNADHSNVVGTKPWTSPSTSIDVIKYSTTCSWSRMLSCISNDSSMVSMKSNKKGSKWVHKDVLSEVVGLIAAKQAHRQNLDIAQGETSKMLRQ